MVIRVTGKRGGIGPSYRNAFYSYDMNGISKTCAWPPKRGKPRSEAQAFSQELFAECCRAMKRMDAGFINYAREDAVGTPMLPRDALMAAHYGRGPTIILNNGERRFSMATRVDMSMLMDNIAFKPGSILFRGSDDLWIGLDPGGVGQVLTMTDPLTPAWSDPEAGGSGSWFSNAPSTLSTSAAATKANWVRMLLDSELIRFCVVHSWLSDDEVRARVWRINASGDILEQHLDQPVTTTRDGTMRTATIVLENPITMPADYRFAIGFSVVNKGDASPLRVYNAGAFRYVAPTVIDPGWANVANANPVVGQSLPPGTGNGYAIMWETR